MSYIGNQPLSVAFLTDQFSGNGSTTAFTMSVAPANTASVLVAVSGVVQDPSTYSVVGTTLNFSAAPPTGTGNISARYLGIPASGVTSTAYRTVTEFTATAGQTTFTPPSYTVGYLNVYRNGVLLASTDYTATNGTTVVLVNAASAGDTVTVESFFVSSILNVIPATGSVSPAKLSTGGPFWDTSGNVGIGTTAPVNLLTVQTSSTGTTAGSNVIARLQSNASGRDATLQLSDNVANSATLSMVGGAVSIGQNGTERGRFDTSGNFLFNSGYGSVATAYGCRAWVNFNGVTTATVRASGNVSSVVRNGTGDYTMNFTTAMPDANYAASVTGGNGRGAGQSAAYGGSLNSAPTTSSFRFSTFSGSSQFDPIDVCVAIFR